MTENKVVLNMRTFVRDLDKAIDAAVAYKKAKEQGTWPDFPVFSSAAVRKVA